MKPVYSIVAAATLMLPFSSVLADVAPGGSDNAGNYVGLTDYKNVNGGNCFIAGFAGLNGSGVTFFGSSPTIDTAGQSFGLSGGTINRTFGPPGGFAAYTLTVGQLFRFQLQSGIVPAGGSYNLTLRSAQSTGTTLAFGYTGGATDYSLSLTDYAGGATFTTRTLDTGVPFSLTGVTVGFALAGNNRFNLTITPIGGLTTTINETYVSSPYAINISNNNAGNLYFNNLAVAPEPGTWAMLVAGACGFACLMRFQRRGTHA